MTKEEQTSIDALNLVAEFQAKCGLLIMQGDKVLTARMLIFHLCRFIQELAISVCAGNPAQGIALVSKAINASNQSARRRVDSLGE